VDNNNLRLLGNGVVSSSDTTDAELKIAQHHSFCPPPLTDKTRTATADPIRKPAKNEWHVAKEHAKEIMRVTRNDLISLNWTEGSTETINRACE